MANLIEQDAVQTRTAIPTPRWQHFLVAGRDSFRQNPQAFITRVNTQYVFQHAGTAVGEYLNGNMNDEYLQDMNEHVLQRLTGLDRPGLYNRLRTFGMNDAHINVLLDTLRRAWSESTMDWYRYATGIITREQFDQRRLFHMGLVPADIANMINVNIID